MLTKILTKIKVLKRRDYADLVSTSKVKYLKELETTIFGIKKEEHFITETSKVLTQYGNLDFITINYIADDHLLP